MNKYFGIEVDAVFKKNAVMKSESKQDILNRLLDELTSLLDEYHSSLEQDKIFEIRKNIRMRIKQIQHQIEYLKTVPGLSVQDAILKEN